MNCARCLGPNKRRTQRCESCEWVHGTTCDGKSCSDTKGCHQPAWPECPEPNKAAAGPRFAAYARARELGALSAELATLAPPPTEKPKAPEDRIKEIRARLDELTKGKSA